MEISVKSVSAKDHRINCLVLGVFSRRKLSPAAQEIDTASGGYLSEILKEGALDGNAGQCLLLHKVPGITAKRVILAACGKEKEFDQKTYRKIHTGLMKTLNDAGVKEALSCLPDLEIRDMNMHWKVRHAVEACNYASYRFNRLKSKKDEQAPSLRKLVLNIPLARDIKQATLGLREGLAISAGVHLARDLGNLPGNICTPSYLASEAKKIATADKQIKATVLGEAEMKKLGMGALLSVSRGSRQPARLIVLEYQGAKKQDKPVVLVGKGVTFDSGGISIKPSAAMDEMKFDMCGAAGVLGTMRAVSQLQLSLNVVAVIPSTENLPDGDASKPGDVVTSMSGQTIEVLNTDAEGRLILCDALSYSEKFRPRAVIDIATLTGACVIALGKHASGLLSNNQALADKLLNAGMDSGDRAWQLPLWDDYQEQLKSNFADMANIGGREAGTITAACFLSRFAKKYKWAHLDIAGAAWDSGANKGATGRPVSLLTQYLLQLS